MARIRYTETQRAKALEMIKSDGVAKASEVLGITKNTLYRWINALKEELKADDLTVEAQAIISEADNGLLSENKRLKAENARLTAENAELIGKIAKMRDIINRLLA